MTTDSSQTMLARATAREDAQRWRDHCRQCEECARSRHRRGAIPPCMTGRKILRQMADSAEQLADHIEADRQPVRGQRTFDDLLTPGDIT